MILDCGTREGIEQRAWHEGEETRCETHGMLGYLDRTVVASARAVDMVRRFAGSGTK
jgi:hypothetical protein